MRSREPVFTLVSVGNFNTLHVVIRSSWRSNIDGKGKRLPLKRLRHDELTLPVERELGLFDNPPGIDHISFAVADVDSLYAELSEAGVKFGGQPENQSWGARMVGLKDPDGNNLYFVQRF